VTDVIALVNMEPNQISVRWSTGPAWFDSYHLGKVATYRFRSSVEKARGCLEQMAGDYLAWCMASLPPDRPATPEERQRRADAQGALGSSCKNLAKVGNELYRQLFQLDDASHDDIAWRAEAWLTELRLRREERAINSLELVLNGDLVVPWTVLYDEDPSNRSFGLDPIEDSDWQPFWGRRYRMGAGRRVDPIRRVAAPEKPSLVLAVDRSVLEGLPQDQQASLSEFAMEFGTQLTVTFHDLKTALSGRRPDMLFCLCHAGVEGLVFDGEVISPVLLDELLAGGGASADLGRFPGLFFLNACRTLELTSDGISFPDVIFERGLAGCIGTEQLTVDTFATPFGLNFLRAFLRDAPDGENAERTVGGILQRLRGQVPLGLLYAAHCPPLLERRRVAEAPVIPFIRDAGRPGTPLVHHTALTPDLPPTPYRSLNYFEETDRALFAGRDGDVLRFARLLDTAGTRILLLHGESGVGKTSFLQAGVIPFLEEDRVGFELLHFPIPGTSHFDLSVRATGDLLGQLADALFRFCGQQFEQRTPKGEATLKELRLVVVPYADVPALRAGLYDDPSLFGRLLTRLGDLLPRTPILVIDQAEEVFTLVREEEDDPKREAALGALRLAGEAEGNFKVIIALRTEYYGRFVDGLRRGVGQGETVREYLLSDFDEEYLAKAIERPAAFKEYGFTFAKETARTLAARIISYCRNRLDSVLPLAQVICSQLYELVRRREDRTIRIDDVALVGGIEGGIRRHVERQVWRYLPDPEDREAFRLLLANLYLPQPDGTLTTGLMPVKAEHGVPADAGGEDSTDGTALLSEDQSDRREKSVESLWSGLMPAEELIEVMSRPEVRLLRVTTIRRGGGQEQRCVSLGHDAIAVVAKEWRDEFERWVRVRKLLAVVVATIAVALVMVGLAGWALNERQEAKHQTEIAHAHLDNLQRRQSAQARSFYQIGLLEFEGGKKRNSVNWLLNAMDTADREDPLQSTCHRSLEVLIQGLPITLPHDGVVNSASFSPDGRLVVTASSDRTARLWESRTGKPVATLTHESKVNLASFSPDGRRIVTISNERTARLWDSSTGKEIAPLHKAGNVNSVSFSPDSRLVIAASGDRTMRLWESDTGKEVATLDSEDKVTSASFSPDGRLIVTASPEGAARLWNSSTRNVVVTLPHGGGVNAASFSPDGRLVLTASTDRTARSWEASTGKPVATLRHEGWVDSASFSPDGRLIVTTSPDWTARLWNSRPGKTVATLRHGGDVSSASFSPDGRLVVTASKDWTARLWESSTGRELATWRHEGWVRSASFSPDGRLVVTASGDRTARLWETSTAKVVPTLRHEGWVNAASFSPDGRLVVTASRDATARLWDSSTGKQVAALPHEGGVNAASFSPDGRLILTLSDDSRARLWDSSTGKELVRLPNNRVNAASFSPDGRLVVTTSSDEVLLWESDTGKQVFTLPHIKNASFSPDGRLLLTTSGDKAAQLWEPGTGKPVATLRHDAEVTSMSFSPDGRLVVTASKDWTARLWESGTGKLVATLPHGGEVSSASFSPDGRLLVTRSGTKTVRVWDLTRTDKEIATLSHEDTVTSASFSPDGRLVLTAGMDRTARLWESGTGKPVAILRHEGEFPSDAPLTSASFSPDGRLVITTADDRMARLWEASTGKRVATLRHGGDVRSASFSPGGRLVLTTSVDNAAQLWGVYTEAPDDLPRLRAWVRTQTAREVEQSGALRSLSHEEWLGARRDLEAHGGDWRPAPNVNRWHQIQAEEAEYHRQWFGAAFHLCHLLQDNPNDLDLRARRRRATAEEAAEAGKWSAAVEDFAYAWRLRPDDAWMGYRLGLAHLGAGDAAAFREQRGNMLQRYHDTRDAKSAHAAVSLGVLLPSPTKDANELVALAERAVQQQPTSAVYLEALGAALFRAQRTREAVKVLGQALDVDETGNTVWMQLFLAMAQHQLKEATKARQSLDGAIKRFEPNKQEADWQDRLRWSLLRKEAETLLGPKP
jgi:WD40 repeat protein/tetratricopeptide (TPR) repeat protein